MNHSKDILRMLPMSMLTVLFLMSCGQGSAAKTSPEIAGKQQAGADAIVLTVDGNTRTIPAAEFAGDTIRWHADPIQALFRKRTNNKEDKQFEINLNFYDKDIAQKLPVTYTLPDDNLDKVVVDLNFFDFERETESRMNKRLVFREGTITIHELGREKVRFDFDGQGGEMLKRDVLFPISGRVEVVY